MDITLPPIVSERSAKSKFHIHLGRAFLCGPSVQGFVIDTLFHIGRSREEAATLWAAATTDPGPDGEKARQFIEQATAIRITIEAL
jgi:hypothetical protein